MKILEAIRNEILGISTVSAAVSTRVYPVNLPEPAGGATPELPAITLSVVFGSELPLLTERSGISRRRVQVSVWSLQYDQAYALREAIKDTFVQFSGRLGSTDVSNLNGLDVLHIAHSGEYDRMEPVINCYTLFLDLMVMHREESA